MVERMSKRRDLEEELEEEDDDFFLDLELDLMSQGIDDLQHVHWSHYHVDSTEHDAMSDLSTSFALESHVKVVKYSILNLHDNRLTDLQSLPFLPFVRECNLSSNALRSCYLPELSSQLPTLIQLDLSGNRLISLKDLPFLPNLKVFCVAFNFLTSIDGIAESLPQLEELDIRGNQIQRSSDLDPLTKLFQLRKLQIGIPNNNVSTASQLDIASNNPASSARKTPSDHLTPSSTRQMQVTTTESSNPVCSRLSNILRLFQNCESLQSIDHRHKNYFEDLFLRLNATIQTPQFDKLLQKYRTSGSNSVSTKKKASSQYVEAMPDMPYMDVPPVVADPLKTKQLSPTRSKVLFPTSQPSSASRGVGTVSRRMQDNLSFTRSEHNRSAFYESEDNDDEQLPAESEDVHDTEDEDIGVQTEEVASKAGQEDADQHRLQALRQMLMVTERSHFRSHLQDLSQAMYLWRMHTMLTRLHVEQQQSQASKVLEETVPKADLTLLQERFEALQQEKQCLQQDLEKKLQQEKIKSDSYQKKYVLQESMLVEWKQQEEAQRTKWREEERLKHQEALQALQSNTTLQQAEIQHLLQDKQEQIDVLTLEIQTFESSKVMHMELLRSKDIEMQELKQCLQAMQEEATDMQKIHETRWQTQEESCLHKIQDLEKHYHALLRSKEEEYHAILQQERQQSVDRQDETTRQMQRLESRLFKLQEAFESVTHNHEVVHKEAHELRQERDKDKQVIKELTKCIQKLQEVTDFKHKSLKDVDNLKQKVNQLDIQLSATELERDALRRQVQDMIAQDQVKQQSTLMQLQQLEHLKHDFDHSKQDLMTKLQVQEVLLKDVQLEAQTYKTRWQQSQQDMLRVQQQLDADMQRYQRQWHESQEEVERLERVLSQKVIVQQRVKKVIQNFITQQQDGALSSSVESLGDEGESDEDWDALLRSADEAMWKQARRKAKKQVQWQDEDEEEQDEGDGEEDNDQKHGNGRKVQGIRHAGVGIADIVSPSSSYSEVNTTSNASTSSSSSTMIATATTATMEANTGICTSRLCQERITSLEQLLHEYQKALEMKQKECEHISESLNKVEAKSKELGDVLQGDKSKYEAAIEKYRGEKKKLTKLCKVLEEDILRKDAELRLAQQKLNELQASLQASFGLLHDGNSPVKPLSTTAT